MPLDKILWEMGIKILDVAIIAFFGFKFLSKPIAQAMADRSAAVRALARGGDGRPARGRSPPRRVPGEGRRPRPRDRGPAQPGRRRHGARAHHPDRRGEGRRRARRAARPRDHPPGGRQGPRRAAPRCGRPGRAPRRGARARHDDRRRPAAASPTTTSRRWRPRDDRPHHRTPLRQGPHGRDHRAPRKPRGSARRARGGRAARWPASRASANSWPTRRSCSPSAWPRSAGFSTPRSPARWPATSSRCC